MRRGARPFLSVLVVATALLGSSVFWCFCAPAAAAASAHSCCEDGPGLVAGDLACCRDRSPGPAARDVVVRGGAPAAPVFVAVVAASRLEPGLAPPPIPRHALSTPAVVLRV